ncbi:kinase-like domain-containing protein [Rhizophagus clarus]|uniref:Kinase-like domain-containing protein n=1 Tax=Rhizophagus clarus TaxID=94130 RepID=A0A8H3MA04_9GLOM|nr:kinase-like domain-containing protein [Rhizophagus clarus]
MRKADILYDMLAQTVEYFGKGEYSILFKANWLDREVVFKCSNNFNEDLSKFLNELNYYEKINNILGFTKVPSIPNYMILMDYANKGLNEIHHQGFIHCNLYDGNILKHKYNNDKEDKIYISCSKFSRPENYIYKDEETYGVLPFMAPEVIKHKRFTKASDIYSFSMIMWEFTSGIPPFNDSTDQLLPISICNGGRPKIIENTPKCYKDLMEKCWNEDPSKRPTASEVKNIIQNWIFRPNNGKINEEVKNDIMEFIESYTSDSFENNEESNGIQEDAKSLDSYVLDGEFDWNS